jgi:hypothetical protein
MNTLTYRIIMGFMGVVIISMVYAICLFTFEKSPITYLNVPFPVSEQRVFTEGDEIRFEIERCVAYPTKYVVTRKLVNDNINANMKFAYLASAEIDASEKGCTTAPGLPIYIFHELEAGSWHVEHVIFAKGKFRTHEIQADSISFVVK